MKVLRTILLLLLLASVLTACGGGDDDEDDDDTPAATSASAETSDPDTDTDDEEEQEEDTPPPASASGETTLNWVLEDVIGETVIGAVATVGDQIFVGNDTGGIQIVSLAGELTGTVANSDIQQVSDLIASPDGNLWVVDNSSAARGIYLITPEGETVSTFTGDDFVVTNVTKARAELGPDGNLYVFQTPLDNTKWVHVISPDGVQTDRFSLTLSQVRDPITTVTLDGNIFITNSRALRVFDATGQSIVAREIQGDAIAGREVVGLDALSDGTIMVAIADVGGGNPVVLRIDLEGNLIEEIDGDFVTPAAFALSEDGSLIIVDTGNGNVSSYALAPVE
jgi:sugar lactone lactonase YvrE